MIRIVYNIGNRLLAEAIGQALKENGSFRLFPVEARHLTAADCVGPEPDILFLDVACGEGSSLRDRQELIRQVKVILPKCKFVLLVDENSQPEAAHEVMLLKQSGQIHAFFHSSVTGSYLAAALEAL